jgi:hypothetical protein
MNITVHTTEWDWWFHYEYKGMNIDVQIPIDGKNPPGPEAAMAWATWRIVETMDRLDGPRTESQSTR